MLSIIYNVLSKSFIVLIVSLISVNFLPAQLFVDFPLEPRSVETLAFDTVRPNWNTKLSDNNPEYIQLNQILGPESIAIAPDNEHLLYTGLADGRLVELNQQNKYKLRQVLRFNTNSKLCPNDRVHNSKECGRFLQLRFKQDQPATLYAIEASTGLYKVDINKGTKTLVGPKKLSNKVNLFNSFAFDPKEPNLAYVTVSSTRWGLGQIVWGLIELEQSGQVLAMDISTGKTVVLINKLSMPNGIEVDAKRDRLLFTEFSKSRMSSVNLADARAAFGKARDGETGSLDIKVTPMIPLLPGVPDNIYAHGDLAYIALPFVKLNGSELIDNLSDAPMLRKAYGRFVFALGKLFDYVDKNFYPHSLLRQAADELISGHVSYRLTQSDRSAVVEYNLATGSSRLLGSDKFGFVSEAVPDNRGNLLLGSFRSPFLVKVKLS